MRKTLILFFIFQLGARGYIFVNLTEGSVPPNILSCKHKRYPVYMRLEKIKEIPYCFLGGFVLRQYSKNNILKHSRRVQVKVLDVFDSDELKDVSDIADNIFLRNLRICSAGITELPEDIGRLFLLKEINIRHTHLCRIPDSVTKCQWLRKLILANNDLVELPRHLNELKRLLWLDISGNPQLEDLTPLSGMTGLSVTVDERLKDKVPEEIPYVEYVTADGDIVVMRDRFDVFDPKHNFFTRYRKCALDYDTDPKLPVLSSSPSVDEF